MAAVEEERTILVPTNPDHVRDALRFFGEPWILFGEMFVDRIERLKGLIIKAKHAGKKIDFPFEKQDKEDITQYKRSSVAEKRQSSFG
ncbi:MAG: hypothetical protein EZS28_003601 [Streblomastix strix]|uniref:Pre-mRNA processing factor 4 (PRP4)-like domain-containing protein n=1 Tax=Streblomastix strix TaxID=222440 RepID=A0A5J4X323_9EUKA|nr:MAG: hypothetical protein EZS28_003601 [Streblomastix strix]